MPPIAQGRHGYMKKGATKLPVLSWQLFQPRNLATPMPVGGTWASNFAEGLRTSRLVVAYLVRTKAGEVLGDGVSDKGVLGDFVARTFSGGFDDTPALALEVSNGRRIYALANAKPEAFTLSIVKGQVVGLQCVYVAPGLATQTNRTAAAYDNQFDTSAPCMYDAVSFAGIGGSVYSVELTLANNHVVNAPLDGTKVASSWDAGPVTAGASLTFNARATNDEPFADGDDLDVVIQGNGFARTITLTQVVPGNPGDASGQIGQSFVTYQCAVLGNAANSPVLVA